MKPLIVALLLCTVAFPKTSHAPLPAALMEAKTVYVDNQSGTASFTDRCYDELSKWGRFKIVSDPKEADIIFRISSFTRSAGATNTTTIGHDSQATTTTATIDQRSQATTTTNVDETHYGYTRTDVVAASYTRIDVVAPSTGQILWSDSKKVGSPLSGFKSATREVVKELRKRMEEQEKK